MPVIVHHKRRRWQLRLPILKAIATIFRWDAIAQGHVVRDM